MKRRSLLAAVGATATAVASAGCLGSDDVPYERCPEPFVPASELPREARAEVDAALETGAYETGDGLVYPEIVGEESTLWIDDATGYDDTRRYYEHRVDDGLLTDVLTFDAVTPARESPVELKVSNQTESPVDVTVTIADADGTARIDTDLTAAPADAVDEVDSFHPREYPGDRDAVADLPGLALPAEPRTYEVSVALADGRSETGTVTVDPRSQYYWVQITADDILQGSVRRWDGFLAGEGSSSVKYGICREPPNGWPERATGSNPS